MAETSKRKVSISALRKVRKGFAIFQKDSSPYFYARIWIPLLKEYLIRSTKEKSRVEALASAEVILQSVNENQMSVKVTCSRSFGKHADELIKEQRRKAKSIALGRYVIEYNRDVPLTHELFYSVLFLVNTWLRPIESEIFALKNKDIEVRCEPNSLVLHTLGKTGYR